jgi:hypothetical protein
MNDDEFIWSRSITWSENRLPYPNKQQLCFANHQYKYNRWYHTVAYRLSRRFRIDLLCVFDSDIENDIKQKVVNLLLSSHRYSDFRVYLLV